MLSNAESIMRGLRTGFVEEKNCVLTLRQAVEKLPSGFGGG